MPHFLNSNPVSRQRLHSWYESPEGKNVIHSQKAFIEDRFKQAKGIISLECSYCLESLTRDLYRIRHRIKIDDRHADDRVEQSGEIVAKWSELPFEPNSVDIIILHHNLEFDESPTKILREAAILLKPHGDLLVVVFNKWSLLSLKSLPVVQSISRSKLSSWLEVVDCKILDVQKKYYLKNHAKWQKLENLLSFSKCVGNGYSVYHARKYHAMPTMPLRNTNPLKRMLTLKPSMTRALNRK